MEVAVEIDEAVLKRVLEQFDIHWDDPNFAEVLEYLKLRYLHYRQVAVIRDMPQNVFDQAIAIALISDLGEYLIKQFELTVEEDELADLEMQKHYRFMGQVTAEERAEAENSLGKLPQRDQAILELLHDGMSQMEIAEAMGMKRSQVRLVSRMLKTIYSQAKTE